MLRRSLDILRKESIWPSQVNLLSSKNTKKSNSGTLASETITCWVLFLFKQKRIVWNQRTAWLKECLGSNILIHVRMYEKHDIHIYLYFIKVSRMTIICGKQKALELKMTSFLETNRIQLMIVAQHPGPCFLSALIHTRLLILFICCNLLSWQQLLHHCN